MKEKKISLFDLLLVLALLGAAVSMFFVGKQTTTISNVNLIPRPYFYSKCWVTVKMEARYVEPSVAQMVNERDLDIDDEKNIVMGKIVKVLDSESSLYEFYKLMSDKSISKQIIRTIINQIDPYSRNITVLAKLRAYKVGDERYVVKKDSLLKIGEKYAFENKDYNLRFTVMEILKEEKTNE